MHLDNSNVENERLATQKSLLLKRLFGFFEIVLIILIMLSIIGVGITDFSPGGSHYYWLVMVPVFAAACLVIEWERSRGKGHKWTTVFGAQLLLWLGLLLAVQLVYFLLHTGRLDNENTGLIILLLLALTTFFAGINLDWRLLIVGIILGLSLIGAAYLETFFWLFFLIAIVVVAALLALKHFAGSRKETIQE